MPKEPIPVCHRFPMEVPPASTVTFFFTDIEGATRILETIGDQRYYQILSLYREIVTNSVHQKNGRVMDSAGDAFFASFVSAVDAVAAGVQTQLALLKQEWPDGLDLRVRVGLHTGEARLTEDGYVGRDLHRASLIASAAHGGQILVSQTTRHLSEDLLPEGVTFQSLGEYRLKDVARPMRLFQVNAPGLPSVFPAPRQPGIPAMSDRALVTIMFTDLVGSTETLAALGDRQWRELKWTHHGTIREQFSRFGGVEIDTAGDGFFAAFDSPTQALRCARSIIRGVQELQLSIRVGLHAGEVETKGEKLEGLTVVIASRIAAQAGPNELVTSGTIRDMTIGSDTRFKEKGTFSLKGVPGDWLLCSVDLSTIT